MFINKYLNLESVFSETKQFFTNNLFKLIPFLSLIFVYFLDKKLFIFTLIICLDVLKHFIELMFHIAIPIYPFDYGMIIMSYLFSPIFGLYLILAMLVTRILLIDFKTRHLVKLPILIFIVLIAPLFRSYNLLIVGPILFGLRYIIEYCVSFLISGHINLNNIPVRIINILMSALCFMILF